LLLYNSTKHWAAVGASTMPNLQRATDYCALGDGRSSLGKRSTRSRFDNAAQELEFPKSNALHLCLRCVSNSSRRRDIRNVKACHANPIVGHPVVNVVAQPILINRFRIAEDTEVLAESRFCSRLSSAGPSHSSSRVSAVVLSLRSPSCWLLIP
jgi:hypothetical protein